MSRLRAKLSGVLAVTLAVGLAACGSAGSSSTTTDSPSGGGIPASRQAPPPAQLHRPHGAGPAGAAESREERGKESAKASRRAKGSGPIEPNREGSIAAYGDEGTAAERGSAEANLDSYFAALGSRDWPAACRHLAASTQRKLEEFAKGKPLDGCPGALQTLIGQAPPFALKNSLGRGLLSLRVKREKGFAVWRGPNGRDYLIPMASEAGGWKPAEIAALPYTAGRMPPG